MIGGAGLWVLAGKKRAEYRGVAKFLAEVTLLAQPFVKGDGKETVGQLVKAQGATVNDFVLYVVGEGIEKKKDDFAAEVAAMTKA